MNSFRFGRFERAISVPVTSLAVLAISAIGLALSSTPAGAAGGVYTVNSTADTPDRVRNGVCADASGSCTLRAALSEANLDGVASRVLFNIPGTSVSTISISTALPEMTEGSTTIDGYSEPGSAPNTSGLVSNARIMIQIRGTGPFGPEALVASSPSNTIRGLALYDVRQGMRFTGGRAKGNVVTGNFIGTNATGTFGSTSFNADGAGVVVTLGATRNRIGGPAAADRNVVSGNPARGILICSPASCTGSTGANDNVIQRNLIGLTPNGKAARPNLGHGIDINAGSSRNLVTGNVLSGNIGSGIEVSHGLTTVDNKITQNRIGTSPNGAAGPAYARNTQFNVHIEDGARNTVVSGNVIGNSLVGGIKVNSQTSPVTGTRIFNNRIGISTNGTAISNGPYGIQLERGTTLTNVGTSGTVIGPANIIVGNESGIRIMDSGTVNNKITRNQISLNRGLGIDIAPLAKVNPNDDGDGDGGPNNMLNFPVLDTPTANSVSGTTCPGCTVEVFLADGGTDTTMSSYGEGRQYLATGTGNTSGRFTIALPPAAAHRAITATATDSSGNTSEFARNRLVP